MAIKEHGMNELPWARLISNIASPPVVWTALMFPIALRDAQTREQAVVWALTYGVLVCLLPMLYVVWMVRRGRISDIHMRFRQERLRPFIISVVCAAAAWITLRLMNAPPVVPLVAVFTLIQLTVIAVITLVWQISMHTMSMACAVVATGVLFGPLPALLVSPLVPLVGAARLKLERHTLSQVVAGALLGALLPITVLALR